MCSKNRLNGSFFCRFHNKIKGQTFSDSLITLCDMLRVQKYKYPPPPPEPRPGSRILYKMLYKVRNDWVPGARRWAWFAATVDSYRKGQHFINFDDGQLVIKNLKEMPRDWVYSDTVNVCASTFSNVPSILDKDASRIFSKYGGIDGVNKPSRHVGTLQRSLYYRIALYGAAPKGFYYIIGCDKRHPQSRKLQKP